jgi:hypothetical protein
MFSFAVAPMAVQFTWVIRQADHEYHLASGSRQEYSQVCCTWS